MSRYFMKRNLVPIFDKYLSDSNESRKKSGSGSNCGWTWRLLSLCTGCHGSTVFELSDCEISIVVWFNLTNRNQYNKLLFSLDTNKTVIYLYLKSDILRPELWNKCGFVFEQVTLYCSANNLLWYLQGTTSANYCLYSKLSRCGKKVDSKRFLLFSLIYFSAATGMHPTEWDYAKVGTAWCENVG